MDSEHIKASLIERIRNVNDPRRLTSIERLLDVLLSEGSRSNDGVGQALFIANDEAATYEGSSITFTSAEVRSIVDAVRMEFDADGLSAEQESELDQRASDLSTGRVRGFSWDEVQRLLDQDRK